MKQIVSKKNDEKFSQSPEKYLHHDLQNKVLKTIRIIHQDRVQGHFKSNVGITVPKRMLIICNLKPMDNPINMYQYSLLFDNFDSCEAKDLEKNAKLYATSAESQNVKKK